MKAVKVKCKIWKTKQRKALLTQFQLFIFYKPACLQKYFHARALSIRVFSSDGHYGLRMNTIASRDQLKPIRIVENLVMNYN